MQVQQLVLEYATPRAGTLEALQALPAEMQLGFGAVNPRTMPWSPEAVASRVTQLAELIAPERIYLNPDCGFGTFADRPVGTLMWRSRSCWSYPRRQRFCAAT